MIKQYICFNKTKNRQKKNDEEWNRIYTSRAEALAMDETQSIINNKIHKSLSPLLLLPLSAILSPTK